MTRPLTCAEVFERLDDFVDRELSAEEMDLVSRHITDCGICASEYRFESGLLRSMKEKVRRIQIPDELKTRLLHQLRGQGSDSV